jgi:hypothetical protein
MVLAICAVGSSFATDNKLVDRVQVGRRILVQHGEAVGDVVCVFCAIENRGNITGDAVAIFGPLDNYAAIHGDAAAIVGRMNNEADVDGDVDAIVGPLTLGPNATVGKDASVIAGKANIAAGALIHGKFDRSVMSGSALAFLLFVPLTAGVVLAIVVSLIGYTVLGQARVATIADVLRRKPGLTFVAGLIAVVVFVCALWAFAQLRAGSSVLVILVSIMLFVSTVVGYTGLSFAIGNRLRAASPVAAIVIGAIIIGVAQAIPVLQFIFGFILLMFALGAAALTGFGTHPEWMEQRMSGPTVPAR